MIRRLGIERFRGIKELQWLPSEGVNVILGGGDVGKTTILEAIGLLLSPSNYTNLSDSDYHSRDIESGFRIEAVVSLPSDSKIDNQREPSYPWEWNGEDAIVPEVEDDSGIKAEPVYRIRVSGTSDLELIYEIVQPNENTAFFSVALRRGIGLVRLGGDDRNDRDLRLVQGSALDRLLSDKSLRSRLASDLAKDGVKNRLNNDAKESLEKLETSFMKEGLPTGLDLAIIGGQGLSVAALIGLTANHADTQLPITSWGAGTRRIVALAIAEMRQGEGPITLVDEVERGLEPYRQRLLIDKLQSSKSQVFVTTHSPFAIAAASEASLWYMDREGKVGPLEARKTERHRKSDPLTFLARMTIVAEGATEKGFVIAFLKKTLPSSLEQYGVHVSDGGGHEPTLDLLEALVEGGVCFGGFVDNEQGKHDDRWGEISKKLNKLLFRWKSKCLEENIIDAITIEQFESLIVDSEGEKVGRRLRTLADRLGSDEKEFEALKREAGDRLKEIMVEAMLGKVPAGMEEKRRKEFKKHGQAWFKTEDGGRELAEKMFSLGAWSSLKTQLLPFLNAVRTAINLPEITDLVE